MTPLDVALGYIERGWWPIPVPYRTRAPNLPGWQNLSLTAETAPGYFNGADMNVGIRLGPSGLTDVDLDCREAVALAPAFLPRTKAIFGRSGKPRSHWLYKTGLVETEKKGVIPFVDPLRVERGDDDKAMLVELRFGSGAQTVFPGSVHDSGEPVEWDTFEEPAIVDGQDLKRRVSLIATASAIVRVWSKGIRHDAALALGGFLARAGWDADSIDEFVAWVVDVAITTGRDDPREKADRLRAASDSAQKVWNGDQAYGLRVS